MSSRPYIVNRTSTTQPTGQQLGDEWFDPVTNRLYKQLAASGNTVVTGQVLAAVNGNVVTVANISTTGTISGIGTGLTGLALAGNLSGNLIGNGFGLNNASFVSVVGNIDTGNINVPNGVCSVAGTISGSRVNATANSVVSATMTVNDQVSAASSGKSFQVNAGTNNWAVVGNISNGSYNGFQTTGDMAIVATGASVGNVGFSIVPWMNGSAGFRISAASNVAIITMQATTVTTSATQHSVVGNVNMSAALGVGTTSYGNTGEIRATNNITAFFSSDARFKANVAPIANAIDIVCAVGGKTFDWTDEYISAHGGEDSYFMTRADFGVIAQDLQRVFPRAVKTRADGTLAVDYEKLVAVAFQAIAELQQEIAQLKQGR